jgi:hypothetical protein
MNTDSDTSADLDFNILDDNNNKIKVDAPNNKAEEPKPKKPDSSDTDYYLNLLANQSKLNDDSDNKTASTSSLSEIIEDNYDSDESDTKNISDKSSKANVKKVSLTPINKSPKNNTTCVPPSIPEVRNDFSPQEVRKELYPQEVRKELSPQEVRMKKIELLRKLSELKTKGYDLSKNYDFNSSVEEMEYEFELLKSFANKRNGSKLYKNILLNTVSAVEFLNDKYDPFDFQLTGWSEHMSVEVDSYDEVIEEIYEKYKGTGKKMPPEIKLLMLIVASASAFHFSKSTFKNLPGVDKVLQNNPDLISKMMNPQKESSQFMTEQEIHIEKQRKAMFEKDKELKRKTREQQESVNTFQNKQYAPVNTSHPINTPPVSKSIKAPMNVKDILNRLHNSDNNNSDTQDDTSSNNDRIVGTSSMNSSEKKKGRKKKSIMTIS